MKLSIFDLAGDCFPEDVMLGTKDAAMTARIKESVMKSIELEKRPRRRSGSRAKKAKSKSAAAIGSA